MTSRDTPTKPNVSDRWIQAVRRSAKTTQSWACSLCPERRIFMSSHTLWEHAQLDHRDRLPSGDEELKNFRAKYEAESASKTTKLTSKDESQRRPNLNEANRAPEPPPSKRPLNTPTRVPPTRSLSGLGALNLGTTGDSTDVDMRDLSDEATDSQPRKRAALGDGISAGSASPFRDSSASPPPRRSKARPTSAPYGTPSGENDRDIYDISRPSGTKKQLWTEHDTPLTRSSVQDQSNIASIQAQRARKALTQPKTQKQYQNAKPSSSLSSPAANKSTPSQNLFSSASDDSYDIILQPETRPISQEQLVAEVKGIYAGLVMVEAKCIEVDNKQAMLAQGDPQTQPKLNNEQWQALIALHRTLLHEHHDFFLASQHPSASPALRRLASKYAMPARMWRHGIHSFLELLRHRLPASLDHMLAFIYLAYSMMALLYETVPAFEDTWIECLGDLGRYRMAIEDDDIRDREVWTGVARHWYSRASDKAPTTGRLYHHLAILARPNALQQLYYYSKSLCVAVPFVSARESILTLFNPVLDADHGQLRLPPLDMAFVKAHGLLFTGRSMEKFDPTKKEFLGLLDNQIGRVTKKFMEQGYEIAISNSVAILGFASKENPLMQAISDKPANQTDTEMTGTASDAVEKLAKSYELALGLSNATIEVVVDRIGDPNVLPFIHITLVFMFYMARFPAAMALVAPSFPWAKLVIHLNTIMLKYKTPERIESKDFPLPIKDDVRPFPDDFALRGLLFADDYYPEKWFSGTKIDHEDKHLEAPSMTDERRERILWLACRISKLCGWIHYSHSDHQFSTTPMTSGVSSS